MLYISGATFMNLIASWWNNIWLHQAAKMTMHGFYQANDHVGDMVVNMVEPYLCCHKSYKFT